MPERATARRGGFPPIIMCMFRFESLEFHVAQYSYVWQAARNPIQRQQQFPIYIYTKCFTGLYGGGMVGPASFVRSAVFPPNSACNESTICTTPMMNIEHVRNRPEYMYINVYICVYIGGKTMSKYRFWVFGRSSLCTLLIVRAHIYCTCTLYIIYPFCIRRTSTLITPIGLSRN